MIVRIDLTPSRPYFLGNDKHFAYANQQKGISPYFITGEQVPSQTSLFGALRYLMLKHIGWNLTNDQREENNAAIGRYSFDPEADEERKKNGFGLIKQISPLFLFYNKTDQYYLPVPLDHYANITDAYTPYGKYEWMNTSEGKRVFAEDYDAKVFRRSQWFNVKDGSLLCISNDDPHGLFHTTERVGINISLNEDGFFKREYVSLNSEFSFSFYATLDDRVNLQKQFGKAVMMGQGSTPFSARITECNQDTNMLLLQASKALMKRRQERQQENSEGLCETMKPWQYAVYCASDMYVTQSPYKDTVFAVLENKDYRTFNTLTDGRITNGDLHHLVRSGSIFMFETEDKALNWINEHSSDYIATSGMNQFVKLWEGAYGE